MRIKRTITVFLANRADTTLAILFSEGSRLRPGAWWRALPVVIIGLGVFLPWERFVGKAYRERKVKALIRLRRWRMIRENRENRKLDELLRSM